MASSPPHVYRECADGSMEVSSPWRLAGHVLILPADGFRRRIQRVGRPHAPKTSYRDGFALRAMGRLVMVFWRPV